MKKLIILTTIFSAATLFANENTKVDTTSTDLSKLTAGSAPFACKVGKFKVINFSRTGEFKKFSLEGKGLLINSNYLHTEVGSNTKIVYMVPSSDTYIESGKYLSVVCDKSLSTGDHGPLAIDFYVEAK
jgi:hypothetical protein